MQVSTGVIRRDGRLELISGRHRFAKMMEDDKVEAHMCYVFIEDAAHDERWATMLDYENNMRDDQADEKTAAVYIRTIPQSDGELYRKGLLRNATKSKRGIFIGRHARQNLFDMFMDDAVSAKDAEVICQLTQNLADEARVEEIQSRAASLLKEGKSWEYIGGMTQLLANKEKVTLKQGLLDLGADFQADLDKMARCIEQNMKALQNAIKLLKMGKKLSKDNRKEAERLGVIATTSEDNAGKMEALTRELKRWEYIGSYPDLIAAVQMWDGETKQDPVGKVMEQYEREKAEAGEQQRAEEMVPEEQGGFDFSASMVEMNEARERYAGTEAAKVIEKVVGGLRAKTKGARSKEELRGLSEDGKIGAIFSHEQVVISPVNARLTDEVAKQIGRDVSLFSHAISEQNIWHAMDGHSNDSVSREHKNQLDLTWEDFDLLPDILDNFNDIKASTNKNGNVKLTYKKSYGDVLYTVIQRASATQEDGSGTLNFVTEWIKKDSRGDGNFSRPGQGMVPSSPGRVIQSQGREDVKGDVSMSVADAREKGLFKDGVMEAVNGVLVDGGADFSASVDFSHVSPALYRRPDKEHVGTGEGNQVYGWGVLYGAESPVVNRSYHRQFTRIKGVFEQGQGEKARELAKEEVIEGLKARGVSNERVLSQADAWWHLKSREEVEKDRENSLQEVRNFEEMLRVDKERGGSEEGRKRLEEELDYWKGNVQVADYFLENDILVRRKVDKYPVNYRMRADVDDGNLLHWDEDAADIWKMHPELLAAISEEFGAPSEEYVYSGERIYKYLADRIFQRDKNKPDEERVDARRLASEWLDEHGIRGVKYIDGATRYKKDKTYNYVIFNPDYVEVIAINNRHEWSEYSEDNPDWQRPEDVDFSASVRNLAAVHTINHDDFINAADELGGMPLPSVAVTRLDRPYSWGDDETSVTLVARPDMVDPRKGTDVYSRDAWTGRMPRIETEEDGEDLRTFFYDEEGEKVDATLENLTDYLYGRKRRGNEATEREMDLVHTARSYMARRMRDMEDVKGQRERLQSEDEVRVLSEDIGKWMDMLHEYDVWLGDEEWIGVFEALADLDEVTEESVREAIMGATDADGRADLSALQNSEAMEEGSDFIAETVRILRELRAEKTDYLEAVPQRAVGMNEWVYALFSDKVGNKESVRRVCLENGITPVEYKEGEREKALGDLIDDAEVSFSVIGEHARTWDKYKDRAFAGRDDGRMRAEIDASRARLTRRFGRGEEGGDREGAGARAEG